MKSFWVFWKAIPSASLNFSQQSHLFQVRQLPEKISSYTDYYWSACPGPGADLCCVPFFVLEASVLAFVVCIDGLSLLVCFYLFNIDSGFKWHNWFSDLNSSYLNSQELGSFGPITGMIHDYGFYFMQSENVPALLENCLTFERNDFTIDPHQMCHTF